MPENLIAIDLSIFYDGANQSVWGCGISSGGAVACWGGVESDPERAAPVSLQQIAVDQIAVARNFACALRHDDHKIECWGYPETPGWINLTGIQQSLDVVSLDVSDDGICALRSDQTVACVANNSALATTPAGKFTAIAVTDSFGGFACALRLKDGLLIFQAF